MLVGGISVPLQLIGTIVILYALRDSRSTDTWALSLTAPTLLSVVVVSTLQFGLTPVLTQRFLGGDRRLGGKATLPHAIGGALLVALVVASAPILSARLAGDGQRGVILQQAMILQALSSGIAVFAYSFSTLNSVSGRYGRAVVGPAINAAVTLFLGALLALRGGPIGAAYGSIVGSVAFLAFGLATTPMSPWLGPAIPLSKASVPLGLGTLALQFNGIAERFSAALFPVGAVTAIAVSNRIVSAIVVFLTAGLSASLLPQLTQASVSGGAAAVNDKALKMHRYLLPLAQIALFVSVTVVLLLGPVVLPASAGNPRELAQLVWAYGLYVLLGVAGLATASACYATGRTAAFATLLGCTFVLLIVVRWLVSAAGAPLIVIPLLTSIGYMIVWIGSLVLLRPGWTGSMASLVQSAAITLLSFSATFAIALQPFTWPVEAFLVVGSVACAIPMILGLVRSLKDSQPSTRSGY